MAKIKRETDAAAHHYIRDKQHGFSTFDADEACYKLEKCRDILLVGLASYGEIDRLIDAQEECGRKIPENVRVIDRTGSCTTTGDLGGVEVRRYTDVRNTRPHRAGSPKEVQSRATLWPRVT